MDFELQNINWGEELLKLQAQKKSLLEEKDVIEKKIAAVDMAVEALLFLGNPHSKMPLDTPVKDMSFQDAVRSTFRRAFPVALLPTEVRNVLMSTGLSMPNNTMVAIHTAISRMANELEEALKAGKKAYRWKQPESGITLLSLEDEDRIDPTKKP